MLKTFCLAATLSTAIIALVPLAPQIARSQGCYMLTSDGWRIDLSSLCTGSQVPVYAINKIPTRNQLNQGEVGLDLPSYCKQKYGIDAAVTLRENNALGWKCIVEKQVQTISFEEACSIQYGPFARPQMGNFKDVGSWHCRLKSNVRR